MMTTILIADDITANLYLLESILKGNGYEVIAAKNGAEALLIAQDHPPDLIISDIMMPVMDGFELCRRIKADKDLNPIPVVFYTSTYTEAKDEQFAMNLGADRFVIKPQKPDELVRIVREILDPSLAKTAHGSRRPSGDEMEILREYNEVLFCKLEKKVVQLEEEIAERRRAEQELQKLYRELEARVEERTVELKSAKEAYRLANTKLNLLNSITRHDLLNQLTALKGYLELSIQQINDPEKLEDFFIKEQKAAATIEHLLVFTRVYQDMGVKAPIWQSVSETVGKATASLPMQGVTVGMDKTDVELLADPLFERVFHNLIDNALRYGGEKMTRIWISHREFPDRLVLTCEDNGAGITEEEKKHLFERGFGKNTGLGLFLLREILSITGLTIIETSEPGKGARFEITVPPGKFRRSCTPEPD